MQVKERGWGCLVSSLGYWSRRDEIGSNAGDQPSCNTSRNSLYSSPACPFILLQYQLTQTNVTCQWPMGANFRATGQSVLQSPAQLTSSAIGKIRGTYADLLWQQHNNNNCFMALCPGLPGWAGTWRNTHPPTILIIIQSLSASSIYHDP